MNEAISSVAQALLGKKIDSVTHAAGGGNSRIYKVVAEGNPYALKLYPTIDKDPRDRLGVEKKALQFFASHHIDCAPKWLDGNPPFALMEWVEGELASNPSLAEVEQAVRFLARIFALSRHTPYEDMPAASEACLSGAEIIRQVEARLVRLEPIAALGPFLKEFRIALKERIAAAQHIYTDAGQDFAAPLPHVQRCLIPADFGFHNAIRSGDHLIFIDFEYFGWDDPVKLICDVLLHPAMALDRPMRQCFRDGLLATEADNPWLQKRFTALYPLFGLRWALILLNEFLPERWQARAFARGETDWEEVKTRQLQKAQRMLASSAVLVP